MATTFDGEYAASALLGEANSALARLWILACAGMTITRDGAVTA